MKLLGTSVLQEMGRTSWEGYRGQANFLLVRSDLQMYLLWNTDQTRHSENPGYTFVTSKPILCTSRCPSMWGMWSVASAMHSIRNARKSAMVYLGFVSGVYSLTLSCVNDIFVFFDSVELQACLDFTSSGYLMWGAAFWPAVQQSRLS